jgi:hypothetical protein
MEGMRLLFLDRLQEWHSSHEKKKLRNFTSAAKKTRTVLFWFIKQRAGNSLPMFWDNLSCPIFNGQESKKFLDPWWWDRWVAPNRRLITTTPCVRALKSAVLNLYVRLWEIPKFLTPLYVAICGNRSHYFRHTEFRGDFLCTVTV